MLMATSFRRASSRCLLLFLLSGAFASACSAADAPPMPTDARVVFLHHSTGGVIWDGGVPEWFAAYNTAHGTAYTITGQAYPWSPYPSDNYPYDYWNLWVNHAGGSLYLTNPPLELLTPQYDVIVFKHCFPASSIGPDTGSPDITSPVKTLENYQLQYEALKTKLRSFPSKRFIVWTGAALLEASTTPAMATRSKQFFDWVKTVWDEPGDNIYVWDFYNLETDGGMYLNPAHALATNDSHPNNAFAVEVAPLFAQRVVDVIQGKGDAADTAHVPDAEGELSLALVGANPATGPVLLRLHLPATAQVELSLYDAAGRRVAVLADGEFPAGPLERSWDSHAAGVPSGIYFARLKAGGHELSRRIVILD